MLPIRIIFLLSAVALCVNGFGPIYSGSGCWIWYSKHGYTTAFTTKIAMDPAGDRCRSHCFYKSLVGIGCNVFVIDYKSCDIKLGHENPSTTNFNNWSYSTSYFLKDKCRGDNCWTEQTHDTATTIKMKRHEVNGERECKIRCMETANCYFHGFYSEQCYIQVDENLTQGVIYPGCIIGKLSSECKKETCWEVKVGEAYNGLTLKPDIKSALTCRTACTENKDCQHYNYNHVNNVCEIDESWVVTAVEKDVNYNRYDLTPNCKNW